MSRTLDRQAYEAAVRIAWLEADADECEKVQASFKDEVGKLKGILVGILISTTTATILLAVNAIILIGKG